MNDDDLRDAYQDGLDYLKLMDLHWQEITGSAKVHLVQDGCEYYREDWYDGQCTDFVEYDTNCNPSQYYDCEFPRILKTVSRKPSDGFILAESAMNGPGATYGPQLMDGSNHIQMKNDSNMKDAIKAIFEDGLDRPYFQTNKR